MSHRLSLVLLVVFAPGLLFIGSASADAKTIQVGLVIAFPGRFQTSWRSSPCRKRPPLSTCCGLPRSTSRSQDTAYGPAICSINNTGCPATNCFCDAAHSWAYYHLNANGTGWDQASEGVGAYEPSNGAVEGLAWSGFDASYNFTVRPPVYTFAQIAAATAPAPLTSRNRPPWCCWPVAWPGWQGTSAGGERRAEGMKPYRALFLIALLLLVGLLAATASAAEGGTRRAALVVRYGNGQVDKTLRRLQRAGDQR